MDDWFTEDEPVGGEFERAVIGWAPCPLWVRVEHLLWWVEGFSVPPLLTTSPTGTDSTLAGQLDQGSTAVLYGNERLIDTVRPGGRIQLGYWLDDCQSRGIEVSYLKLASRHELFRTTSPGDPILTRPFYNVEPGNEGADAELIAFPSRLSGEFDVHAKGTFESAAAHYRHVVHRESNQQVDLLVGWRFNRLNDSVTIHDSKTAIGQGGALALGTTVDEVDRFATRNVFHGAEIGVVTEKIISDWSIELATKLAVGNTRSRYIIDGSTTVSVPVTGGPPAVAVTPAGLLAQGTNIGVRAYNEFAVVPEIGITAGYQFKRNCRVTFGYTLMYWSHVARAGNAIDSQLNLSQLGPGGLVGPSHPTLVPSTTDLWVQGLNLGLDVRF
jgi:hypothetical protein